jgi:hypothetical protein
MAAMIGPAFYAGFKDIGFLPDLIRRVGVGLLGWVRPQSFDAAADLGFYETTFLGMQKKIFEDQATMHAAYVAGGVGEVEEFYRAGIIDLSTLRGWQQIDRGHQQGDLSLIDRGNRALLFREQFDIIDRFYVQMLQYHRPEGEIFSYLLTLLGAPSVPGTHSYPQRFPLVIAATLPGGDIQLSTPLADGNIAVFANRWKLIDDDTLPGYLTFVRDHANEARELVATPIAERVIRYRLVSRAGELAREGLTSWRLHLSHGGARQKALGVQSMKPLTAQTQSLALDLTTPPTYRPGDKSSAVWMNHDRQPFDVAVSLPQSRAYRARAEVAVLLSSAPGANPDRLIVQLPSTDLSQTEQLLTEYGDEWGFPTEAIAQWRVDAERRASSDRDYSTQVFTPDDVGFVHLEFQVSHHVRESDFMVAALFSW